MDGIVEIITGRERRRQWSTADKLRIVAKTHEPGVRVRDVAARYGVSESLVYAWRQQEREGLLAEPGVPVFTPVQMLEAPAVAASSQPAPRPAPTPSELPTGLIEIALGDGCQVRVGSDVSLLALRRVLAALRG